MGVYGYGSHRGATILEGYLKVEVPQPDGSRFEEETFIQLAREVFIT